MTPTRTGERNEVYRTDDDGLNWRHFDSNGEEISRGSETLTAEHPERVVYRAVEAYPTCPTWLQVDEAGEHPERVVYRVWVLLQPADVAHYVSQHLHAEHK